MKQEKINLQERISRPIMSGRLSPCSDGDRYWYLDADENVHEGDSDQVVYDNPTGFKFGVTYDEIKKLTGKEFEELSDEEISLAMLNLADSHINDWYLRYQEAAHNAAPWFVVDAKERTVAEFESFSDAQSVHNEHPSRQLISKKQLLDMFINLMEAMKYARISVSVNQLYLCNNTFDFYFNHLDERRARSIMNWLNQINPGWCEGIKLS